MKCHRDRVRGAADFADNQIKLEGSWSQFRDFVLQFEDHPLNIFYVQGLDETSRYLCQRGVLGRHLSDVSDFIDAARKGVLQSQYTF